MGVFVSATCDGPEDCAALWYGDDVDLSDKTGTVAMSVDYLVEYEDWAVDNGKLLCPDHKAKDPVNVSRETCSVCNGIDPDCAACEAG